MGSEFQTSHTLIYRALDTDDEDAWNQLVEHYKKFIFYIFHRLGVRHPEIEDLSQQVLVSLLRDLPQYDRTKASFRTWLSQVVRNLAIGHFRKEQSQSRRVEGLRKEVEAGLFTQPSELDLLIEKEWTVYLAHQAMERVRAVFKGQAVAVFEMGVDGLSATEIAAKTGLTVSTVYTLKKRVKKRLYLELLELTADLEL